MAAHFHRQYLKYIRINMIITEWKQEEIQENTFARNKDVKTFFFGDDQALVSDSEDALQICIYTLETFTSKDGLKVSKTQRQPWLLKVEIFEK